MTLKDYVQHKEAIIGEILDLFERFMPKDIAVDDRKQLAMYEAYHRIKKLNTISPSPQPKGMKWVKASERLPERGKVFVRYTDTGKMFVFNCESSFQVQIDFDGYHYKMDKVEWIDESSPIDAAAEAIAFEQWRRNNAIEWNDKDGYYQKVAGLLLSSKPETAQELYTLFTNK